MHTISTDNTLRFPVRRDRWDTVDYYLWFYVLFAAAHMGIGAYATMRVAGGQFAGWFELAYALVAFGFGVKFVINKTWQRYAEEYVLTPEALVFEYGYRRLRVPYENIAALHPIKVCRNTTALKPAHRINFLRPIGFERAADAYPQNSEGFLEELAARCPQLERDGPRMWLREASAAATN